MAQIQLSEKVYQKFYAKTADYGFETAEEFIGESDFFKLYVFFNLLRG